MQLLAIRSLIQMPRIPTVLVFSIFPSVMQLPLFGSFLGNVTTLSNFPTENYYEYLAPGLVLFTSFMAVGNASVGLVTDFQTRYFQKILLAPISVRSIFLGRLVGDGIRVFALSGFILAYSVLFGAEVATGIPGALLMLLISTLFAIVIVGTVTTVIAVKTKDVQATQAALPLFFITSVTSAYMPIDMIPSDVFRDIIRANPAQYVLQPIQSLMITGYNWYDIGIAFSMIGAFGLLGFIVTWLSNRNLYN
jgi:ABC-2 type transport system permease protein